MLQRPKISEDCEAGRHYDCDIVCSCECHEDDELEEDEDDDFKEEIDL